MSELRCITQQVVKYLHYIIIITVYDQFITGWFKNELYARVEGCPRRIYRSLATSIDINSIMLDFNLTVENGNIKDITYQLQ